jgi:hypothetical protein
MGRVVFFACVAAGLGSGATATPDEAKAWTRKYCLACHQTKSAAGGFDANRVLSAAKVSDQAATWKRALDRVKQVSMPPKGAPSPTFEERERMVSWIEAELRAASCAVPATPVRQPLRRLNRSEYAATVRDLLNIHINAGHALPADGAGGEGFDNAAETLFLSPVHAEKYLDAARLALDYAMKDPRSRARFLTAEPGQGRTDAEAARKVIEDFLPRAFRRPAAPAEADRYLALFQTARARGDSYQSAISFALQGVLLSPNFLFRLENPPDYALASRLSYFLWGSMPDAILTGLAEKGKLHEPEVLAEQVKRMLTDARTREFAERFVEQWLNTRELGRDIKPDPKLFPAYYDEEVTSAIRYEPILFFQEILAQNFSLLNLIDSNFTILTNKLQRFYGINLSEQLRQQPRRVDLPEGTHRGGLVSMAAVLAVSSYSHRTSPVLRGKWVLEAMLGTPPPPPPPDVPTLAESDVSSAKSLREKLSQHRANAVCASCHSRIDPIGFALENYDVIGRWRTDDVDNAGELPDGTQFSGPDGLKRVLLDRKRLFLRHLTSKMLGYALGRGLRMEDSCTVENIVDKLETSGHSAHTLVREIVLSPQFLGKSDYAQ